MHIHVNPDAIADSTSFLVIQTKDRKYLTKRIEVSDFSINLGHTFSYPQEGTVVYYYKCSPNEVQQIKMDGSAKRPFQSLSFFVSDTVQAITVDTNGIHIVDPSFIQQRYRNLNEQITTRVKKFNIETGNKLHEDFRKAPTRKEKDSIRKLGDRLFKTNVARLNLDSSLMPAIENDLNSPLSLYAMDRYIFQARVLQMHIPKEYFDGLLESMSKTQKESKPWRELKETVAVIPDQGTCVGKMAPPFVGIIDTSGNPVKLKSFRGKLIFIDFWASWCLPCKRQLPMLKEIYRKTKEKDVIFIGVSLDFSSVAWKNEIIKSKLDWVNASDLKFTDGVTTIAYGVTTIPHNFLIDKEGTIISENVPLDRLEIEINKALEN